MDADSAVDPTASRGGRVCRAWSPSLSVLGKLERPRTKLRRDQTLVERAGLCAARELRQTLGGRGACNGEPCHDSYSSGASTRNVSAAGTDRSSALEGRKICMASALGGCSRDNYLVPGEIGGVYEEPASRRYVCGFLFGSGTISHGN